MAILVKNISGADIEVNDLGLTLEDGVVQNIQSDWQPDSDEFKALVDAGDVVFVLDNGTELSANDSQTFLTNSRLPQYEGYYTKAEVDAMVASAGHVENVFQAVDTAGGMTITNVAQVIEFDLETHKDSFYNHSTTVNPGEIEILQDGLYKITSMVTVATVGSQGGTRGNPVMAFEVWNGASWDLQPDRTGGYIREDGSNSLSTSMTGIGIFDFTSGIKFRIVVWDTVASEPNEETVAYSSRVLVEFKDKTGTLGNLVNSLDDVGDVIAHAPAPGQTLAWTGTFWAPADPPADLTLIPPQVNNSTIGLRTTETVDSNATGIGAALFLASDGNWEESNATDMTAMPIRAMAMETGTGEKDILYQGYFRHDSWTFTPGKDLYASTTPGVLTHNPPTAAGNIVQKVGFALTSTIIYFMPGSYTVIEVGDPDSIGVTVNVERANLTNTIITTATIPKSATPTNTSGDLLGSETITVTDGANSVRIHFTISCEAAGATDENVVLLIRDTNVVAVASVGGETGITRQVCLDAWDTPGAGSHTYNIRVGVTSGTGYFNRTASDATPWGGVAFTNNCWLSLAEVRG